MLVVKHLLAQLDSQGMSRRDFARWLVAGGVTVAAAPSEGVSVVNETPGDPQTESAGVLARDGVNLGIAFNLTSRELYAAGPLVLELTVTNRARTPILYLTGTANIRPAYLRFSAELQPPGLVLRDPYPKTPLEPGGVFASISLQPGQSHRQTVVVNQFVTLEDTRGAIPNGQSARLQVRWQHFVAASTTEQYPSKPEAVDGSLQVTLVRDDEKLRATLDAVADTLLRDSGAAARDPVGRRDAIAKLASVRIPEVIPHLRKLADFPDFEVRRMAQFALSELQ
jgi:hypothetical protein